MSCGEAYCHLYIEMESVEDVKNVIDSFSLMDGEDVFWFKASEYPGEPCRVDIDTELCEIGSDFYKDIRSLDNLVREKYGKPLQGHWIESDGGVDTRYEIKDGAITSAGLNWLEELPVSLIEHLQEYSGKIIDQYD